MVLPDPKKYPHVILSHKFAPEVVGDGSHDTVGPFEMSLGKFYKGGVVSLVAG